MRRCYAACLTIAVATSWGPTALAEISGLSRVVAGYTDPTFVGHAPGDADRMFVVEQAGTIRIFDRTTGAKQSTAFLNITGLVDRSADEEGLLGLAFHPDFQDNGKFYVNYTHDPGPGLDRTRVDEYTAQMQGGDLVASSASRVPILSFEQDFDNHNGGWLGFSPNDGMLYISSGDGGSGNDPNNRGQSLNTRLGKMLRIDISDDDFPSDPNENYAVPSDNPFVGDGEPDTLDDIWAYGLRNPWRASFDRLTGDLWIGDVGQGAREEIDFQAADSAGGANYGWRLREGNIQTPGSVGGPEPPDHVGPIYEYTSNGIGLYGGNSVVGGYVYRGPDPEVNGRYFFGDSFPRQIWTFDPDSPAATVLNIEETLGPTVNSIGIPTTFGEDFYGNLYIADRDGEIYRIDTDATLPGDYNGDRVVSALDYAVWRESFGSSSSLAADGNGDGIVNAADYVVWRNNLGAEIGVDGLLAAVQVPEPATLLGSIATLVVGIVVARRRAST
ncbi:PQQ-dependent sugar dehydrogenase [Aeoliella sp.]|uniref:PQQ-dependent sugar dehydrogenase n=1 Tax=Aeoliella sp. TaxID=2795800 RepID=UPI003CCC1505